MESEKLYQNAEKQRRMFDSYSSDEGVVNLTALYLVTSISSEALSLMTQYCKIKG